MLHGKITDVQIVTMISRDDVRTSNHIPQLLMAAFQNDNCIVIRNKGLKPIKKRIEIVLAVLIITVGVRIVVVSYYV